MKVYIITAGNYSDYHICAVFTNEISARKYANLCSERKVEVYEADSIDVSEKGKKFCIYYDYENNKITDIYLYHSEKEDSVAEWGNYNFVFTLENSDKIRNEIGEYGKQSTLLLKIAQDRFSAYLAEKDMNYFEFQEWKKKKKKQRSNYPMYTTASVIHELKLL